MSTTTCTAVVLAEGSSERTGTMAVGGSYPIRILIGATVTGWGLFGFEALKLVHQRHARGRLTLRCGSQVRHAAL